jgi:hypothetical protein
MAEALRIAAGVATPLGLLGLVIGFAFFAYSRWLKHKEKALQSLPETQRAQSVDTYLTRYGLDLGNLTREQKFDLVCREMDKRAGRAKLYAVTAAIVFVICFSFAAYAYATSKPVPKPTPPPEEFSFATALTADDPTLPDELFGAREDDEGMPRHWLRIMDAGAAPMLKLKDTDNAKRFWLLTNKFDDLHSEFTASVYAGTPDKVTIVGFLVESTARIVPLRRAQDGTKGVYLFHVPESRKDDRLLVYLAMKQSSYDAILPAQKFRIRSRPL